MGAGTETKPHRGTGSGSADRVLRPAVRRTLQVGLGLAAAALAGGLGGARDAGRGLFGPTAACAEPPAGGLRTAAVIGMGNGTGSGVPAEVLRFLAGERVRLLLSSGTAAASGAEPGDARSDAASDKEPAGLSPKLDLRGKFKERAGYPLAEPGGYKMSCYWLAWESEYASEPYDVDIYTRQGFRIGRFPRAYVFELKMEGSGILRDGRVINYDGTCSYGVGTCFTELNPREHPLGKGGQQRALLPFKSVAVDPRFVPLGTPLFLPELAGLRMPDGSLHDGCVRADDTGGGIKRHELDFFVESYANYKFVDDQFWGNAHVTPYVEEPRCAYLRRYDPVVDRRSEATDWAKLEAARPPPPKKGGAKKSPGGDSKKSSPKKDKKAAKLHHRHSHRGRG